MLFTTLALAADPTPALRPDVAEYLAEGWRRFRADDFDGSRQFARSALEIPGAHDQEAAYLMGRAWQIEGYSTDALDFYRSAYARQPLGAFNTKLEFHIAETLSDTGEPRQALKWLRKARRGRELDFVDEAKFELNHAMFILEKGKIKRGTKRLLAVLDETDHDIATWHQAKARTQLVELWLDVADELGTESPVRVERRALLLSASRDQLLKTIEHGHDRFTLQQIMRVGQSYEHLGDDVVTVNGNRFDTLPPDARKKVETVWVKATRFYDIGVRHAERSAESDALQGFVDAHAMVVSKVDRLP